MMWTNHFPEWDVLSKTAESFSCIEAILDFFCFSAVTRNVNNYQRALNVLQFFDVEFEQFKKFQSFARQTRISRFTMEVPCDCVHITPANMPEVYTLKKCKTTALLIQHSITKTTTHINLTSTIYFTISNFTANANLEFAKVITSQSRAVSGEIKRLATAQLNKVETLIKTRVQNYQ